MNETCAIALVQAGTKAKQFASTIDRACNIKIFLLKITQAKVYFFLKTPRRLILNFLRLSQEKE